MVLRSLYVMRRRVVAALAVVLGALVAMPSPSAAQVPDGGPAAVDVDLAPGGLWLTYADARVDFVALSHGDDSPPAMARRDVVPPAVSLADGEAAVELLVAKQGWWIVTSLGRVIAANGAQHHGDMIGVELNEPVVDAASTSSGAGYLMLAADGGVFAFGDAIFYGSVQGIVDDTLGAGHLAADYLSAPVVTLGTTDAGYWLVAADGAVFPFGDASYYGSHQDIVNTDNQLTGIARAWTITPPVAAGKPLARDTLDAPIISLVPSADYDGYIMLASDGGIFSYGNTRFVGSFAHRELPPAVAIDVAPRGVGYVTLTADGSTHVVGDLAMAVAEPDARQLTETSSQTGATRSASTDRRASAGGMARRTVRSAAASSTTTTTSTTTSTLGPTPLMPPPADACRPDGPNGFPVVGHADVSDGTLDVLVVFAEFDDAPHDDALWSWATMNRAVSGLETFLETQSYARLDASFTVVEDWVSLGATSATYQVGSSSQLDVDQVAARAVSVASAELDAPVDGDRFDAVLVVLPPSRYRPPFDRAARLSDTEVAASPTPIGLALVANGEARAPREPIDLDDLLRDLLADALGLHQAPPSSFDPGGSAAVHQLGQFGFVALEGWWPTSATASVPFTGVAHPGSGDAIEDVSIRVDHTTDLTDTFLGWSRWRLGWIARGEVACIEGASGAFDLAPLEGDDPTGRATLAVVPLSERQLLVLEARRWLGNDADVARSGTDGPFSWSWERQFEREGVLAYLVDPTLAGAGDGRAAYALLGSDASGLLAHSPFVGVGDGFTLTGANGGPVVTVAVTRDDGTAFLVDVRRTEATAAARSYAFDVARRVAPAPEALLPRSCRPDGPEGFPIDQPADLTDGTFDVLVVFAEFGDARHDEAHLPWSEALGYLEDTESFLEAQSYGRLDVNFVLAKPDGWITLADAYAEVTLPWSETSIDIVKLTWNAALAAKAEGVDFAGRASQFDSIAVLLPPSHFRGASAFNTEVPTDDEPTRTPLANGLVRLTSAGNPTIRSAARLGTRARADVVPDADYYESSLRHELLHNLGLNDLYSYRSALRQVPDPSPREDFLHGVFGQMAVHGFWPVPQSEHGGFRTRTAYVATGAPIANALVYTNEAAVMEEMLGWSRWRLGWLDDADVACVFAGTSTVELDAIAGGERQAGDAGTRLAIVPLGGKQLLVLEARRHIGYDSDTPRVFSDGRAGYNRELPYEGVFAYLVNPTIGNGNAPITVLGHTGRECAPRSPILRLNETATLRAGNADMPDAQLTLEVTVTSDDGTTFGVNIDYRDATTGANEFELAVARTPVVDLDASGCVSEVVQ